MKCLSKNTKLSLIGLVLITLFYTILLSTKRTKLVPVAKQINISTDQKILHKLLQLKYGYYHSLPGQWNCQNICRSICGIPKHQVPLVKPIGNYSQIPKLGITPHNVRNLILPQLNGGSWAYKVEDESISNYCSTQPKEGVAIIIVCKNRWNQLYLTLATLIPLLQRQHLCYRIFVIEQAESGLLNKAKLMNIGFMEAAERFHFKCVVFHDADLAPINDLNPYGCDNQTDQLVVHLGVGLDVRNFKLNYPKLLGGVLKISNYHFVSVNGYSNQYWGWGQEDDDLESRLTHSGIGYVHMNVSVARYMAVPHKLQPKNNLKDHRRLLKQAHVRIPYDGLNSLKYDIISIKEKQLFTHIVASVGNPSNK